MEAVPVVTIGEALYPRQAQLMRFINEYQRANQRPPSTREMMDAIGVRSTNAVAELVTKLNERGLVERLPRSARSVRLTWRGRDELKVMQRLERETKRAKKSA
jgi:SOS-response transcriptional repressor LexA